MSFAYPKKIHQREESPPLYTNYRKYKPYLQKDFKNRCVYCKTPDTLNNYNSFGVDHYKPQNLFRHLANVYANLFYACNRCNTYKGEFWQDSVDPDLFIPNPCDHVMFDHLQFVRAEVKMKSKAGEFSGKLLQLNDTEFVQFRETIITALEAIEFQLTKLNEQLIKLNSSIPSLKYFRLWSAKKHKSQVIADISRLEASQKSFLGMR